MTTKPDWATVQDEVNQAPNTRERLYRDLEKCFKMSVVSLFTSFRHPVVLDDSDADMLEDALRASPPKSGLLLVLNSPGGMALAAERLIRVARKYASGKFEVAVPKRAKSAATMVCLGADTVWMGPTSELGPINPQQLFVGPDGRSSMVAVQNVIDSYEELMAQAVACTGKVDPLLMQLARFDAREIKELRSAVDLAGDIAVKALQGSMMAGKTEKAIRARLKSLTDVAHSKSHGRPIYFEEARKIGLKVRRMAKDSTKWRIVQGLYTKLSWQVSTKVAKMIETRGITYTMPVPQ